MVRMLLAASVIGLLAAVPLPTTKKPDTFRNPLKVNGADPWLQWHDGEYYLTTTTGTDIRMRHAKKIGDLRQAKDTVVWQDSTPGRAAHIWATEFFYLDGENGKRWYGYYTASDDRDDHHRMYVIESEGSSPLGPYHFKGKVLTDPKDEFYAIDGSVISLPNGDHYFVWCGRPSKAGQGIYIQKMKNPWTLEGERQYLEADGFGVEWVREGPVALVRNGRVFLIYSMCPADTPDYRLGMLVASDQANLADAKSWKQHPEVVFARNDEAKVYGPGHNSFFRSPDGKEDWIVYHAKVGTERTYADRTARAQKFTWNADGTPNFGVPISTEVEIPVPSGE